MRYAQQMASRMPSSMSLPSEFYALFDWMEVNSFFMPSNAYPDDKLGLLGTKDDIQSGRVTAILFRVATREQAYDDLKAWFGQALTNIEDRLVPFARTGSDGSYAAFWLDDDGRQQIVHLGSEGLACLLGRTALDFLCLLAIGYEEISGECLDGPNSPPHKTGLNVSYRAWLTEGFGVGIPKTASQILDEIPDDAADVSNDPFWRWVRTR